MVIFRLHLTWGFSADAFAKPQCSGAAGCFVLAGDRAQGCQPGSQRRCSASRLSFVRAEFALFPGGRLSPVPRLGCSSQRVGPDVAACSALQPQAAALSPGFEQSKLNRHAGMTFAELFSGLLLQSYFPAASQGCLTPLPPCSSRAAGTAGQPGGGLLFPADTDLCQGSSDIAAFARQVRSIPSPFVPKKRTWGLPGVCSLIPRALPLSRRTNQLGCDTPGLFEP